MTFIPLATAAWLILAAPPEKALHDFLQVALSPDGQWVASVEGDMPASGGDPVVRGLTIRSVDGKSTKSVKLPCGAVPRCWPAWPAWSPDSRSLYFALRSPSSHARSLYKVANDGSTLQRVLAFDGTLEHLRFGPKGKLAMLATAGATKEQGAIEAGAPIVGDIDTAPPEQRIAWLEGNALHWASPADTFVYEYDWLPDGTGFVGTAALGDGDRNWWVAKLYAFDAVAGSGRVIYAPSSLQQQLASPKVSPDGERVAFIAGLMSDFGVVGGDAFTLNLKTGAATNLTVDRPSTVTSIQFGCDGHLLTEVLKGGERSIVDLSDSSTLWHGEDELYDASIACPSGAWAVAHERFDRAIEIQVGPPGRWHDLTQVNSAFAPVSTVKSVTWRSDAFTVQGWLLLPLTMPGNGQALPMLTFVHGGPSSAKSSRFVTGLHRALLQRGYALFYPNPRGSYGQGEAFTIANVRDFGFGDLRDILAGVDAAAEAAPIDRERLGIFGHSYGGFMSMWAVTQTDRFKAAVAAAGISNWQSYAGQNGIDEWLKPFFGATVYDDPAIYAKSSPIVGVKKIRTPLFSYVGEADIECPAAQTIELAHALRALGKTSSTVIYPGEGHSIRDPAHLADIDRRTVEWFDKWLKR